jgi:hypothetical protein
MMMIRPVMATSPGVKERDTHLAQRFCNFSARLFQPGALIWIIFSRALFYHECRSKSIINIKLERSTAGRFERLEALSAVMFHARVIRRRRRGCESDNFVDGLARLTLRFQFM